MITIFGLRNCDSCKKARAWLDETGLKYRFHDFRQDGLPDGALANWCNVVGWEPLLNRRSTTWRGLDEADRSDLDAVKARQLMETHPTLIKRPVFETAGTVLVGFSGAILEALKNGGDEVRT